MAGKPLFGTPFADLLPASVRQVPEFAAAAQALDAMLYFGDAEIGFVLIWSRIDGLEEPLLSNLAYGLHLEAYEGWHLAETLEQKRRLVKEAVKLHFHKGTEWSLERVFELLDMRGLVTEWWEAPDDPDFKPYEFDMDMEIAHSMGDGFYRQLLDLVDALKNLRSHLRRARIFMTSHSRVPAIAPVLLGGVFVTLRPFMADIAMHAAVPKGAVICQILHEIEIRPLGGNT